MSAVVDGFSERFLKVDDLEAYDLTQSKSDDGEPASEPAPIRDEPKETLHYQSDNSTEQIKTYLRVVVSMQVFTFALLFIVYLLLWRSRR